MEVLHQGGIVALPTETYYGLAVDPFNHSALEKLFALKGREEQKPILVLIEDVSMLLSLTPAVSPPCELLIEHFWPGPLTLVFQALPHLSPLLTGGTGTVGVRMSPHPYAETLGRLWQKPFTATSGNISGHPPAKNRAELEAMFGNDIDYILDGGETEAQLCSTVVSVGDDYQYHIIRPGMTKESRIRRVLESGRR